MLRRLRHWWVSPSLAKTQRRSFVTIGRGRYKRLRYPHALMAAEVEANLVGFGFSPHLPELVARHEQEVWVRYVPGAALAPSAANHARLAAFFAHLHCREASRRPLEQTGMVYRLASDLRFLEESGVLDARRIARLHELAEQHAPQSLWCGFDYVDPVLKNFILTPAGEIVAVDVESLVAATALGTGLAKAGEHWLGRDLDAVADAVVAAGAPDFRPELPYVRLCFLAGWSKRKLLTGKVRFLSPKRFDALLESLS